MAAVSEPVNPGGHAAWGAVIYVDGQRAYEGSGYVGSGPGVTNNVAEYQGLVAALDWLIDQGLNAAGCSVTVRGDSMLVAKQMSGRWKVRGGAYVPFLREAQGLAVKFPLITFHWVPREENGECDRLSKKVLTDRGIELRIQPQQQGGRGYADKHYRHPAGPRRRAHPKRHRRGDGWPPSFVPRDSG